MSKSLSRDPAPDRGFYARAEILILRRLLMFDQIIPVYTEPIELQGFRITTSENRSDNITEVSPDIAVCDDCLEDMHFNRTVLTILSSIAQTAARGLLLSGSSL